MQHHDVELPSWQAGDCRIQSDAAFHGGEFVPGAFQDCAGDPMKDGRLGHGGVPALGDEDVVDGLFEMGPGAGGGAGLFHQAGPALQETEEYGVDDPTGEPFVAEVEFGVLAVGPLEAVMETPGSARVRARLTSAQSPQLPGLPRPGRRRVLLQARHPPHHVGHGLMNWRALARHLGRREHMSDTVQAVAGLLSHQQITDPASARKM